MPLDSQYWGGVGSKPPVISPTTYNITEIIKGISLDLSQTIKTTSGDVVAPDDVVAAPAPDPIYNGAKVIVKSTAPTGLNQTTDVGTIWRDEDTTPPTLSVWTGYEFIAYTGVKLPAGTGLDAYYGSMVAATLTATTLYNQGAAPAHANGRLHRDTDDGKVYRSNGTTWTEILDVTFKTYLANLVTFLQTKGATFPIDIFYQSAAPGGGGVNLGDVWLDVDDYLRPYWFDGIAWIGYTGDSRLSPETDGFVPPYSPAVNVQPGIGCLFLSWEEVPNRDMVTYDIYIDDATPAIDPLNLVASVQGSIATLTALPNGTPLDSATTYFVKIRARDDDGVALLAGAEDSGMPLATVDSAYIDAAVADIQADLDLKSVHTLSAAAPGATPNNAGDVWERHNGDGVSIIGRWRGAGGTSWTAMNLDATYIPDIDIGTGTFGDLSGTRITARTIGVESLLVTGLTNLITNPSGENADDRTRWNLASGIMGYHAGGDAYGSAKSGAYDFVFLTYAGGPGWYPYTQYAEDIPVTPGEVYRLSFWSKRWYTNATVGAAFWSLDVNGNQIGGSQDTGLLETSNGDPNGSWVFKSRTFTVPDGVFGLRPNINIRGGGGADIWFMDDLSLVAATDGSLIVDGSVTTTKLSATAVDATYLTANSAWINALRATSLVGETITGAIVRSSATATTNGVQMTSSGLYGYKSGSPTFSIDNTGTVTISGTTAVITGAQYQTASSGERIVVRNDGGGGIIESYSGLSGESPGVFDPSAVGGLPNVTIRSGTTGSAVNPARLSLQSNSSGNSSAVLDADNVTLSDGANWFLRGDASETYISHPTRVDIYAPSVEIGNPSGTVTLDAATVNALGAFNVTGATKLGSSGLAMTCVRFGVSSATTNASGQTVTTHSMGVTPSVVLTQVTNAGTGGRSTSFVSATSTTFTIQHRNAAGASVASGLAADFTWVAIA